ncbi:unnamed protein product [Toxocara canis]|uniref:Centromere-associated protein E n=1 Tax=Toxocara canis TaxID=6265 RepID=A0A183V6A2_TOXCA|nr:unnamed protein product [Toxocara canis]
MAPEVDASAEDAIKVVVRLRPPIQRETGLSTVWFAPCDQTIQRTDGKEEYTFDRVFDGMSRTEDVYSGNVEEVVKCAMAGYNGTVFAYGQTASGKTYTIFGDKYNGGIVQMAVDTIFSTIESGDSRRYLLRMSCVEIYNEHVRDLLSDRNDLPVMELKGNVVIKGIIEEVITDRTGVDTLIQAAFERRAVGETSLNEHSSRSHAILRFVIESHDDDSQMGTASYISYLNIVDLAGSENAEQTGNEEVRLREGSNVNRSLFALSRVIFQLSTQSSYISFRDSKLTRLLKTSLGGNSKTLIICTASPVALNETSQALKFASRAKFIKNKPVKNKMTDDALLSKYLRTIEELRKKLEENQKAENHERDLETQNEQLSAEVRRLRSCILSGQQQQQLPSIIDERKRRRARRQTWGGARAFRMSLSPTFGGFGSSLALFHSKNVIGSPIEEESTPCASGRSSMETDENRRMLIADVPEESFHKLSDQLKNLEGNENGSDTNESYSTRTSQTSAHSNVPNERHSTASIRSSLDRPGMHPLIEEVENSQLPVAACDPSSVALTSETAIRSQETDLPAGTCIPLEGCNIHDRSSGDSMSRMPLQNQGTEFDTAARISLGENTKQLHDATTDSIQTAAEQGSNQGVSVSISAQCFAQTAIPGFDEKLVTAVEWSADESRSIEGVNSCATVGHHSLTASRGTVYGTDGLSKDGIKIEEENAVAGCKNTPARTRTEHETLGESPSEEEDAPAKSRIVENLKKCGGDTEMRNKTDGEVVTSVDGGLLETSVIAFSTCRPMSVDELEEELGKERLARKQERMELTEMVAELKKRLSIYDAKAVKGIDREASNLTIDPQLEEERAVNNHLREILSEGKKKYDLLKEKNKDLEMRVKWLETENELWGRRCDEADETEGQLREEINELDRQKKNLMHETESLKKEIENMKREAQLQKANNIAEGVELQRLRDEKKQLEQLVKNLQTEVMARNKKVSALQCELRRVSNIRKPENVTLSPMPDEENAASANFSESHTPTPSRCARNPGSVPPSAPSKQKFGLTPETRLTQQDFENSPSASEVPTECNQQ